MTNKHVLTFRASPEDEARIERIAQALMHDGYDVYYKGEPSFQKIIKILLFLTVKAQKPASEHN